jgi:hypothetical protein
VRRAAIILAAFVVATTFPVLGADGPPQNETTFWVLMTGTAILGLISGWLLSSRLNREDETLKSLQNTASLNAAGVGALREALGHVIERFDRFERILEALKVKVEKHGEDIVVLKDRASRGEARAQRSEDREA